MIEHKDGEKTKQFFLTQVEQLFGEAKNWLSEEKMQVGQGETKINEEITGIYTAPTLLVSAPDGEELAEIIPIGACIIEALGRIDIEGLFGIEHIGYFINGGPLLSAERQLYKEIQEDGWYWIANTREPKAGIITKDLLLELIKSVSHYGFQPA